MKNQAKSFKIKLAERLSAFYESLQNDGYHLDLETKGGKIIFTVLAEDYKEVLDVVGLIWKIGQKKKKKRGG